MSFIRKVARKIFLSMVSIEDIRLEISKSKIEACLKQVSIGKNSSFYEESLVENLSNDSNKIKIGNGTHIRGELFIWPYSNGLTIGDNSYVGKRSVIWSGEKVEIGNNVLISHNVTIIDSNSHEIDYVERAQSYANMVQRGHSSIQGSVITAPIVIEDDVWISYNVSILKGVRIGKGSIIGAGSVITKDVPSFSLVAGNPAKLIKKL